MYHYYHSWADTRLILPGSNSSSLEPDDIIFHKKVALQKLCNPQVSYVVIEQSILLHIFSRRNSQKRSTMAAVQTMRNLHTQPTFLT